jgi:hypothetical protein
VALGFGRSAESEVIEDQQLRTPELTQHLGIGPVRLRESKFVE